MLRSRVIEALTVAVAAGDESVAYTELGRVEWLGRGAARRLLARALLDATHRSGETGLPASEAARHVLRVASLELRGIRDVDPGNPEDVRRAYEGSAPPSPRARFPVATAGAGAGALALAALVAWQALRERPAAPAPPAPPPAAKAKPAAPKTDFSRRLPRRIMPAPSADAYRVGGVPLSDPRLEKAFSDTLPRLVVVTDAIARGLRDTRGERPQLEKQLRDPELLAALGERAAARWTDLLDTLAEVSRLKPSGERYVNAAMRLHDAAGLLDDELSARGLAYHVDADVWSGAESAHAALLVYQVEEVLLVRGGEQVSRVLVVRRIDNLNVSLEVLGMQAEHLREGLVLREQLEAHAVTLILPAIDTGRPLELGDPAWNGTAEGQQVAEAAGQAVRAELDGPLGDDVVRARVVGGLLVERNRAVEGWRRKVDFPPVETALIPARDFQVLRSVLGEDAVRYGLQADLRLTELDVEGVVARVADILTPSVARHEAQHVRDAARDVPLAPPAELTEILGPERDAEGRPNRLAISVKNELSGYLSELAANPDMARLELILLAHSACDRRLWGTRESYAATFIIARLAQRLGAPVDGPLIAGGAIDRVRLARALLAVLAHPTAEVQRAAQDAWGETFGEPLVVLGS